MQYVEKFFKSLLQNIVKTLWQCQDTAWKVDADIAKQKPKNLWVKVSDLYADIGKPCVASGLP